MARFQIFPVVTDKGISFGVRRVYLFSKKPVIRLLGDPSENIFRYINLPLYTWDSAGDAARWIRDQYGKRSRIDQWVG